MNNTKKYHVESNKQISAGSFVLEPLSAEHSKELFWQYQAADLYTYVDRTPPESLVKWKATIAQILRGSPREASGKWLTWVGRDKKSGRLVGWFEATIRLEYTELAYTVFKDFQQKGLATNATRAIIDFLIEEKEQSSFVLEMDTRNRASVKTAEKLGFCWEKTVNNTCDLHGFQSHEFRYRLKAD